MSNTNRPGRGLKVVDDGWDADRDFAWLLQENERIAQEVALHTYDQGGDWLPVALGDVVDGVRDGNLVAPTAALMRRTDGVALLYPGQVHGIAGEPESGKGWMVLAEAASRLKASAPVLYLDFEDDVISIVDRLLRLGVPGTAIKRYLTYVRPDSIFNQRDFKRLLDFSSYSFAVVDGVTDAFELLDLDINDNKDAARFRRLVSLPIARRGAATVEVDHVTKATDGRGRYAIGAQKKLAGVAVQYKTAVVTHPSQIDPGHVKLFIEKDRHGRIRGHAVGGVIAEVRIVPSHDGLVAVRFDMPEQGQPVGGGVFRPTVLMERAWQWIKQNPGRSKNDAATAIKGNKSDLLLAIGNLSAEGYVHVEDGPHNAHLLHADKPYTQDLG